MKQAEEAEEKEVLNLTQFRQPPTRKAAERGGPSRIPGIKRRIITDPPWKKIPKGKPTTDRLKYWRNIAYEAALAKGARRACGLCKRATMGQAYVTVGLPWPSKGLRSRWLCSDCWRDLVKWLEQQEFERDGYDLPIDKTAQGVTRGSGVRGSFINR